MMGLLLGIGVLSFHANQYAQNQIAEIEKRKIQDKEKGLAQIKLGIENSILMEHGDSLALSLNVDEIKSRTSANTYPNESGRVLISSSSGAISGTEVYAITNSEDPFVKADVAASSPNALFSNSMSKRPDVGVLDTTSLRTRQLDLSRQQMGILGDHIYQVWSRKPDGFHQFPNKASLTTILPIATEIVDFWGRPFDYERHSLHEAVLSFTTPAPWSATYSQRLSMSETASLLGLAQPGGPDDAGCTEVGLEYGGGVCVTTGSNALIAAKTDLGSFAWGVPAVTVRGTTSSTDGKANTATLAAYGESAHPAAFACSNLNLNGFADWYLPAKDELWLMYQIKALIGGFSTQFYWSSSEASSNTNTAWQRGFNTGGSVNVWKTNGDRVRCVRRAS